MTVPSSESTGHPIVQFSLYSHATPYDNDNAYKFLENNHESGRLTDCCRHSQQSVHDLLLPSSDLTREPD